MARFLVLIVALGCFVMPSAGSPAGAAPDNFTPSPGPTFNSPLGGTDQRRMIFHKILRSINSTPRGSEIQIQTWNFLTSAGTDALLNAQRRGVKVRMLMDASNNTEIPNGPFRRLRFELREGNKRAAPGRASWARMCDGSCRGTSGAAHSKFFMFSKVGDVRRVVMQGSANLTLASTNNQWNDIYTHTRTRAVWNFYDKVFNEAAKDKRAPHPFASENFHGFRLMMFPLAAKTRDPVMQLLNKIKCSDATNTASHRTRIRMAPDVIRQQRGLILARKVRQLWDRGCDIKIGYTVIGVDVGKVLRSPAGRGPIPMKHLVQDFDEDGEFDNYFHLKAMSVVGNVGGDRSGYVVLNGSSNWSGLARVSDENLGIYWDKARTLQYDDHIDYWYTNFPEPPSNDSDNTDIPTPAARRATTRTAGPDDLVFGKGRNAVFEDGTPYSLTGVDPYAHVDVDLE